MEGAGYGGGTLGENIYFLWNLLQELLMSNAKALLFINNQ